jgi:hypothetical protein
MSDLQKRNCPSSPKLSEALNRQNRIRGVVFPKTHTEIPEFLDGVNLNFGSGAVEKIEIAAQTSKMPFREISFAKP